MTLGAKKLDRYMLPTLICFNLLAGVDILVIQGTVVSAEHVSTRTEPLNLKQFIAGFDLPVIVGGCASYSTALHLMRTGAVGVLVGVGPGNACTTRGVLGVGVPRRRRSPMRPRPGASTSTKRAAPATGGRAARSTIGCWCRCSDRGRRERICRASRPSFQAHLPASATTQ